MIDRASLTPPPYPLKQTLVWLPAAEFVLDGWKEEVQEVKPGGVKKGFNLNMTSASSAGNIIILLGITEISRWMAGWLPGRECCHSQYN